MADELASYIEEVALFYETGGLPRIAGRILGLLLVCDPPHRSAGELATELKASRGSVSTMTRMLLSMALIKRVAIPGERATRFALTDDGFEQAFENGMKNLAAFRPLAERGLALLEREGPERGQRLRDLCELYSFWEAELPKLLAKWRKERDKKSPPTPTAPSTSPSGSTSSGSSSSGSRGKRKKRAR